jgi:hypothetical protein
LFTNNDKIKYYNTVYGGIADSLDSMTNQMGTFSSTFGLQITQLQHPSILHVILDFVAMGFAILSGFTFNIGKWKKN